MARNDKIHQTWDEEMKKKNLSMVFDAPFFFSVALVRCNFKNKGQQKNGREVSSLEGIANHTHTPTPDE